MTTKLKLSQWHGEDVKPVHAGLYQVRNIQLGDFQEWAFWLGEEWGTQWFVKEKAIKNYRRIPRSKLQNKSWRGVVK